MRLAAIEALVAYPPEVRWRLGEPFLDDPLRALRIETAQVLAPVPREAMGTEGSAKFDQAFEELLAVERITAERPETHVNLGVLHTDRGVLGEADSAFQRALELDSDSVLALVNLADLLRRMNRDDEGGALLKRAIATDSQSAEGHHALGLWFVRQKRLKDAIVNLRRAAELAPDNTRYGFVLAIALNQQGAWPQALKTLERVHESDPLDRQTLLALVTINRDRGFTFAAKRYARKLLALNPANQQAQQLLNSL